MSGYCVVKDGEYSVVIRRSRFLTVTVRVENEDEAQNAVNALKAKYHDATHVCYAYRIGVGGGTVKFSDAGEPKGTAGAPILAALTENECTYSLIAVVRWFGGVKLGAGGLTRAYRSCAADAVERIGKSRFELKNMTRVTCSVSKYSALVRIAESAGAAVSDRKFAENAEFTLATPPDGCGAIEAMTDAAQGNLTTEPLGLEYVEIK